jgi:tetratricopeptide (TPR) repeat protein
MTLVCSGFIALCLIGCAGPQPSATTSSAAQLAHQLQDQAERLTHARNWVPATRAWQELANRYAILNDRTNQAAALLQLSRIHREQDDLEQAHRALVQSEELYTEVHATREWWTVQIELIQLDTLKGHYPEAGRRLDSLAARSSSLSDPFLLGMFHNETGLLRQREKLLAEADLSFREAEKAFKRARSLVGLAAVGCNRAQLLCAQGQPVKAVPLWSQSLRFYEETGDAQRIAYCLLGRGEASLALGSNLEDAERDLRRASENYRLLKNQSGQSRSLTALADCLRKQNKTTAAAAIQSELEAIPSFGCAP